MRITSTKVETRGAHDHVSVWVDGALSGTLIVSEGAGPALGALIANPKDRAVLEASAKMDLRERPDGLVTCYDGSREVVLAEWARRMP